jgi:predicted transcriptional regulator
MPKDRVSITIDKKVREQVKYLADNDKRSFSWMVEHILSEHIQREEVFNKEWEKVENSESWKKLKV